MQAGAGATMVGATTVCLVPETTYQDKSLLTIAGNLGQPLVTEHIPFHAR
jgi:hypothetical protein